MSLKKYRQKFIEEFLDFERTTLKEPVIHILADMFEELAKSLNMTKVYFWADLHNESFVRTKLCHTITGETKFAIYCFASDQDAKRHPYFLAGEYRVDCLDIFSALLHFFAFDGLDTIIFFNRKGKMNRPVSVNRHDLVRDFRRNCQLDKVATNNVATKGHFGLA